MITTRNCPICGKSATGEFQPFCSNRCATVDLGRWLGEKYSVPTQQTPEEQAPVDEDV